MNWYYESGGQQQGPVADSELDRLLAEGRITLDTLVWREGMAGWTPLRTARPSAPPPVANIEDSDPGWEVTRPGTAPLHAPGAQGSDAPEPGWIRCTLTGRYFPPSEIIYLEGKPYSAGAKPQVVASMQTGAVLPTAEGDRTGPAWEQREQLGTWRALVDTVKAVLFEPTRTFSNMKREGGLQNPLIFNLIVGSAAGILFQIVLAILQSAVPALAANRGATAGIGAAMAGGVVGMVVSIIMVPAQVAIGAFIGPGILHLCLMLLKAAPRPFETTFRAMNYAYGAVAALQFIPVLGWIVMIPWSLVTTIIGIARAQEISTGKAALAVFLPIIVCGCLFGALFAGIASLGAAAAMQNR